MNSHRLGLFIAAVACADVANCLKSVASPVVLNSTNLPLRAVQFLQLHLLYVQTCCQHAAQPAQPAHLCVCSAAARVLCRCSVVALHAHVLLR
jgi:hypothetical protein